MFDLDLVALAFDPVLFLFKKQGKAALPVSVAYRVVRSIYSQQPCFAPSFTEDSVAMYRYDRLPYLVYTLCPSNDLEPARRAKLSHSPQFRFFLFKYRARRC